MQATENRPASTAGPDAPEGRRSEILHAANRSFAHYGYQRTSLNDIAREAGLSRTLLYHYFANKEDIFRACVEDLHARAVVRAQVAADADGHLASRLAGVLQAKLGWFHDLLHRDQRHGGEITDVTGRQAGDLVAAGGKAYEQVLAKLLATAAARAEINLASQGFTATGLAHFLHMAGHGLNRRDGAWLSSNSYNNRLAQLANLTLAGLGWQSPDQPTRKGVSRP